MISKSYANLLDLANGNFPAMEEPRRKVFPRTMTVAGVLSEIDDDQARSVSSDALSAVTADRLIVVANQLPLKATRVTDEKTGELLWDFKWDESSLYWHIKDGLPDEMEVIYVGSLKAEIDPSEQDDVSQMLLEKFKCVPAFLPPSILDKYYHGFCKQYLWPLFHYRLPFSGGNGGRFDRGLWEAYVSANKIFAQKVIEVINPDDDYVWIHDYHLMVLPTFLRRHFNRLRMGFFLHSPFPSSEIYRTVPVREEILKALLNADLVGFHTFDYARHFLSCCSRMLGLEYQSKRGYIGLEYYGRTIGVKIMPSGIHMGQMESVLKDSCKQSKVRELEQEYAGKMVLLGVDDMDTFKGVNLKVLAMEQMLKSHRSLLGHAVLVQILNPARGKGRDVAEIEAEIRSSSERINQELGTPGYMPIVLIDKPLSLSEKAAYYTISEAAIVTAIRDGMNLTPYEYVVCRQGISGSDASNSPQKSMLVVSEFVGCSPSLSGAIRVNPWDVDASAEAMYEAISISDFEKQMRHEKHYKYVSTHDVAYWARSFFQDLERTCVDHFRSRCWGIGLSFGFRVVALDPMFRKLTSDVIMDAYERAQNRAILLDYDGTVMPQSSIDKRPSAEVISIINRLCSDPKNTVFVVSGRGKEDLAKWFAPCERLGIAAEHGYFMRWLADEDWQTHAQNASFGWMHMAEPVMRLYTESTDGSSIERKESALVWHFQDADTAFGSAQAKEMLDHLESVLANEPVVVKSGQYIIEVKPQGVTKGSVAQKIFESMFRKERRADFVLCVGDDRSDEDMFVMIGDSIKADVIVNNKSVFACTVGQKPSRAEYYLDDTVEVINMLENLGDLSGSEDSDS
ncbi:putative alpha,alpha-trehalose-phosphate synthase (UDP-forming), Trehalose-phosphatase [Helianthus annuus]|uniref:alpha,alpha-trehalose-phosphate synthase (UDP-forming) n=1 Tax=Helianthus annuus TaxID=4232 RepID=A0A251RRA4_HELAN|nr:probable alpha,alpha-trehalose-phosphate synthase [UDP-forming] 7 [Helianthus annuus]KAF5756669.1 putative alpha,alpha-trehalose-phosphate synthase (UDP-forming), Trehalose-phosphatase [Helianthus annuus]